MAGVDRPVSVADCPRCGSLCYGASILRCGHVICRKCLVFLLEVDGKGAVCPFCPAPLHLSPTQSRSDLMQNLATDPVITQRVVDKLVTSGQFFCCNHPEKEPTHVCFHCDKLYCGTCRSAHRKKQTTAFHLQQKLQPAPAPSSGSLPQPSLESEADETTRRQDENEQNLLRDSLRDEIALFTEAKSHLSKSLTDIVSVMEKLGRARDRLQTKLDTLDAYSCLLTRGEAILTRENGASGVSGRMRRVREGCPTVPADCLDKLKQVVDNVLNNVQDETREEEQTTNDAGSYASPSRSSDLVPFSSLRPKKSTRMRRGGQGNGTQQQILGWQQEPAPVHRGMTPRSELGFMEYLCYHVKPNVVIIEGQAQCQRLLYMMYLGEQGLLDANRARRPAEQSPMPSYAARAGQVQRQSGVLPLLLGVFFTLIAVYVCWFMHHNQLIPYGE